MQLKRLVRLVYAHPFRAIGLVWVAWGLLTAPLNLENRQLALGALLISLSLVWTTLRRRKWLAFAGYAFLCVAALVVLLHQA